MKDPIVEEVRAHRMAHTQEFGSDLKAICAHLRSVQVASGHELLVKPSPKKRKPRSSEKHAKPDRVKRCGQIR